MNKKNNQVKNLLLLALYAGGGLAVLICTTLFWASLGAQVHSQNADQLVNSYLFESPDTFSGALMPYQHSFLFKWPLFLFAKILGFTDGAFMLVTLCSVILTVVALAYLLYKIENRMLVFGTICLAMASTLMLIPAQPYDGALLPVNMAMITTRNLEYILYILCIVLILRSTIKAPRFWLATILLAILFASDRLFISLSVGGAILALIAYSVARYKPMIKIAARFLLASVLAVVLGMIIIFIVERFTHIVHGGLSPYGIVNSVHDFILGVAYAAAGLAVNFGALPITDPRLLSEYPGQISKAFANLTVVSYAINFAIFIGAIISMGLSVWRSFNKKIDPQTYVLPAFLTWILIAALGSFLVSEHYWPVDFRYLGFAFFVGFIALATVVSRRNLKPRHIIIIGAIIFIGIILATPIVAQNFKSEQNALSQVSVQNRRIAGVLKSHKVDVLVGNYWRVLPIRLASKTSQSVLPLNNCTDPRDILSSKNWQKDLNDHSFAYLLSLESPISDAPACSFETVMATYGRPNKSVVISGTIDKPKELLLFYDDGIVPPPQIDEAPATIKPITLNELNDTFCPSSTIFQVVAHQDDDLLFLNPTALKDIKNGHCIRTLYLTAGDSGSNQFYWLRREEGAIAAYSTMLGVSRKSWTTKIVKLSDQQFVRVATSRENPNVSLLFMRLPDGNVNGQGFKASQQQSLQRLSRGNIGSIKSVDGQSVYTRDEIIDRLGQMLQYYSPSVVRAQANDKGLTPPDHSDHLEVGQIVSSAYEKYKASADLALTTELQFFMGYPVATKPENVSGQDLTDKISAFKSYAEFDGAVCASNNQGCEFAPVYQTYLKRSYPWP